MNTSNSLVIEIVLASVAHLKLADWALQELNYFLPASETVWCTVHFCTLTSAALHSTATIPLNVHTLLFLSAVTKYHLALTRWPTVTVTRYSAPTNYCTENGQGSTAIFSTECMFGFGAACPAGVNVLSSIFSLLFSSCGHHSFPEPIPTWPVGGCTCILHCLKWTRTVEAAEAWVSTSSATIAVPSCTF